MHGLGKQYQQLPLPEIWKMTAAATHDLLVLRSFAEKQGELSLLIKPIQFTDQEWSAEGVIICTPDKKQKKSELYELGKSGLWSRFVSAMRQPIESLFNWIIEKTNTKWFKN